MERTTIRSVVRLAAVITILVGTILSTQSLVALIGLRLASGMPGLQVSEMAGLGLLGVLAQVLIVVWGAVLFMASDWVADRIAETPGR